LDCILASSKGRLYFDLSNRCLRWRESIGGDGRGDDGLSEDDGDPMGKLQTPQEAASAQLFSSVFSLRVARTDVMDFISALTSACVQTG
jgi:hypothetical protein